MSRYTHNPILTILFFLRETICFISNNFIFVFCLLQLAEPYYAFKAAGFEVTIASTAGGAIPIDAGSMKGDAFTADSKKFMLDAEAYAAFSHSVKLDASVHKDAFDCVYMCGGHGCCVDFAGEKATDLVAIASAAYAAGKIVAAGK